MDHLQLIKLQCFEVYFKNPKRLKNPKYFNIGRALFLLAKVQLNLILKLQVGSKSTTLTALSRYERNALVLP